MNIWRAPKTPTDRGRNTRTTGTGFPKVFYLKYDMYRNAWPLLALATYRKILNQSQKAHNNGSTNGKVNGHEFHPAASAVK
ncbi:MAG: hypothetical protein WDN00_05905 [Limisphaerales bacterium]